MKSKSLAVFAPLNILVVDDDPMQCEILEHHFAPMGFVVRQALNGKHALEVIREKVPDVVICDRRMPEMSGAELLERIRQDNSISKQVIFIFLTALTDRRDRYAMMDLDPDAYLCKPLVLDSLDSELHRLLTGARKSTA